MQLFQGVECFARTFNMIRGKWGTVSAKCNDRRTEIWREINDVFLALFSYVGEEQVVECGTTQFFILDFVVLCLSVSRIFVRKVGSCSVNEPP